MEWFVLGSLSIGILGYAFVRNWNKWKERRLRRFQQSANAATDDSTSQIDLDEEAGDVPEGELCVIGLMRRRRSAFIPCGHLVCCQHCAVSVERELVPSALFAAWQSIVQCEYMPLNKGNMVTILNILIIAQDIDIRMS